MPVTPAHQVVARYVLAHHAVAPSELWSGWRPDPLVVAGLLALAVLYREGAVRGRRPGPRPGQVAAFAGGLAALAVALASPLEGAAGALFSAHMVQHLLLVVVAAPLLVAGRTVRVARAGLPAGARRRLHRLARRARFRRLARAATHPLVAWALATAAVWAWHLPALYDAAVRNDAVHAAEHLTLLGTAVLLWAAVLGRRPAAVPVAVGLLFATALQGSALGAVLTLARSPLYGAHEATTAAWGLTPLEDQQLAGALMWVPPGIVYLAVMAALLVRWLGSAGPFEQPGTAAGRGAPVPTGEAR